MMEVNAVHCLRYSICTQRLARMVSIRLRRGQWSRYRECCQQGIGPRTRPGQGAGRPYALPLAETGRKLHRKDRQPGCGPSAGLLPDMAAEKRAKFART